MRHFLVQRHTQARFFGNLDKSVLNNRLWHSFDQIIPERNLRRMKLEQEKIRNRSAEMCRSQSPHWAADIVRRHRNGFAISKFRNAARHRKPANLLQIRSRDPERMLCQNLAKPLKEKKI